MSSAHIIDCNALCAAGRGPEQIWTSIRSGIGRIGSSRVMDRRFDPIQMGLVPEDALTPLPPELDELPLPGRARRMLRLGATTLAAVAKSAGPEPICLFLAVPRIDAQREPWISSFALHLARMADVTLDESKSRVIPVGRAGALIALELALAALATDPTRRLVIGGVDTYLDVRLLGDLDAAGRILGPHVMDGFVPGEGAAFQVLAVDSQSPPLPGGRPVRVLGAASARDAGHQGGQEPARGEGLADAIEKLRGAVGAMSGPIATTFAGLTGESFEAKLWGVASLRHRELFSPNMQIQHPADCIGDAGAAAGAILTVLAATALTRDDRGAPALVWAASDHEPRACALLDS